MNYHIYGLILVHIRTKAGLIISLFMAFCGLFALLIHTYFLRKGHPEFNVPISKYILVLTGFVSLIQAGLTIYLLI